MITSVKGIVEEMERCAKDNKVFVYDKYYITYVWTLEEYVAKGGNLKDYLDTYYTLKSSLKED